MLADGTRDGPGVDGALPVQANRSTDSLREDHRTRVGRERRERMRNQLLQSVLAVCAGRGPAGAAVIDDVVRHASVSRGTFYNHFESIEQAVSELGLQLAD
ncbi:TetR/AcrR family transcriptional regulator, partial [Sphingomonas sp.]|uniref:TetR/AcrR family transcriptional regulator n=1 Tax=Sphingomonas sp. TaxID=28214 RepID=UPI0035BC68C6